MSANLCLLLKTSPSLPLPRVAGCSLHLLTVSICPMDGQAGQAIGWRLYDQGYRCPRVLLYMQVLDQLQGWSGSWNDCPNSPRAPVLGALPHHAPPWSLASWPPLALTNGRTLDIPGQLNKFTATHDVWHIRPMIAIACLIINKCINYGPGPSC